MAEDAAMTDQLAPEHATHWLKSDLVILVAAVAIMVVAVLGCLS